MCFPVFQYGIICHIVVLLRANLKSAQEDMTTRIEFIPEIANWYDNFNCTETEENIFKIVTAHPIKG